VFSYVCAAKLKVIGVHRGREAKVEAFENVKFFQVWEEKCRKLRRSTVNRQIGGEKRSGPLIFTSRRSSGGAYRRRRPTAIGSHSEIPSTIGSGEDVWSKRTRRKDLGCQIWSRYPTAVRLDRSCTRLSIGILAIGNRDSRGRVNRDIPSLETSERSGPSIRRDAWQRSTSSGKVPTRKRPSVFSSSGYR
jgi:hypothetical protein